MEKEKLFTIIYADILILPMLPTLVNSSKVDSLWLGMVLESWLA